MADKAHRRVQGGGTGEATIKAADDGQGLVHRAPQVESASRDGQAAATTENRFSGVIVGIGASAGGLASIERFFHAIPAGTRIAFVLVQHLSPDHRCLMAEIMVKHTSLRVEQATNGRRIESGTLYLIPPGKVMRVTEGRLTLEDRDATRLHLPIDTFFQSMAEEYGSSVIAVVLSGTGSDGTQGIRDVKQRGGIVLVQDDTAQFDGMPRSAISTGLADFILPPDRIAATVMELAQLDESRFHSGNAIPTEVLDRVLAAVGKESGLDFRPYRERTLRRRIEKRMWMCGERDAESYMHRLEGDPAEVKSLCRELTIGVTSLSANSEAPPATPRRGTVERQVHRLEAALLSQICSAVVRRNDQAAVVVGANEAVLYRFGNLAPYFNLPEGRPSSPLARGLAAPLANVVSSMLRRMRRENLREATGRGPLPDDSGLVSVVDIVVLTVDPGRDMDSVYLIVLAQPTAKRVMGDPLRVDASMSGERVPELEGALVEAKSQLQVTIEELQSANEELHTVNAEYQRKLAEQHMLTADMEHLLQTTDIGTIFFDAQNRVRRFTPAITGIIPLLSADVGRPISHIEHLLVDVDLEQVAHQVKQGGGRVELEVRTTDSRTFMLRAVPYHDYGDHVDGVVVTLFDVTALDRARREIAEKERRFRQVAENIDDVIWVREGVTGAFLYLSPVAELFWGRSIDDMMNNPELWLHGVHPDDRDRVAAGYARGLRKGVFQLEYRIVTPDGATRWVQDRGFPVIDDDSESMQVAGVTTDVTASKQTEDELRSAAQTMTRLALHDALTGLHNRRGFEQALASELGRVQRSGDALVAVLIDCDNFKRINDEFGHDAGDEVLREIAHRLGMSVRPSDVMARIGGDEFLALLPSTRKAEALRVAERMRATVAATPVFVRGRDLEITVSIGVSSLDPHTLTMPQLLADLHHGLAASKRLGKNRVADARGDGIGAINPEVFGSLLRSGSALRVVAQSIRSLADGQIVGYELLSRGPAGLLESPEALFRTASTLGMLSMTDMQCLRRCLSSAGRLRVAGNPLRFHVNVYPSTLLEMTEEQREEIFACVHGHDDLCLEISEQQVVGQPTYLRDSIQSMRDLGLRIAIDDVGFGRSSLESLIVLEPDMIKIDRSFVHGVATERQRRDFLTRLLTIADSLKSDVVAEGIENDADAAVLQDLGVRQAQGWLWDRPTPIESLN